MSRAGERGYATLAALAAATLFGVLALEAIESGRSAVVSAQAELSRARLTAAADAGVARAIHDLAQSDPNGRWPLVGPPHVVEFGDVTLTVAVEDENGKVPLNFIAKPQLRRLFELAGADQREIDGLVDGILALREVGGSLPAPGGEARRSIGPLTTVDELALAPHMTPALFARIAPFVTVSGVNSAFDPRTASPLALAVMEDTGPAAAGRASGPPILDGRAVTIRVDAADKQGGELRRTTVVEFTGVAARPYVVRSVD